MTATTIRLPSLDWASAIADPDTGRPTPYFQRFWQNITVKVTVGEGASADLSGKVNAGLSSGWTAPTGASAKTTFTVYASPAISNPPTQAQVQAISDHVAVLSQHMKALIDAGIASGLLTP